MAEAILTTHAGGREVSLMELATVPTPAATRTWQPVPHFDQVMMTDDILQEYGWQTEPDPDKRYRIALSADNAKMFFTGLVSIPDIYNKDASIAIGGRNSHDKTFSARFCMGRRVWFCDNLAYRGDIQAYRIHWRGINLRDLVYQALDQLPRVAKATFEFDDRIKEIPVTVEAGVSLLAEAVERKALAIADFMPARKDFLTAYEGGDVAIQYGGTVWSVYQACTAQYKSHFLARTQDYSIKLDALVNEYIGR